MLVVYVWGIIFCRVLWARTCCLMQPSPDTDFAWYSAVFWKSSLHLQSWLSVCNSIIMLCALCVLAIITGDFFFSRTNHHGGWKGAVPEQCTGTQKVLKLAASDLGLLPGLDRRIRVNKKIAHLWWQACRDEPMQTTVFHIRSESPSCFPPSDLATWCPTLLFMPNKE